MGTENTSERTHDFVSLCKDEHKPKHYFSVYCILTARKCDKLGKTCTSPRKDKTIFVRKHFIIAKTIVFGDFMFYEKVRVYNLYVINLF